MTRQERLRAELDRIAAEPRVRPVARPWGGRSTCIDRAENRFDLEAMDEFDGEVRGEI